LDLRAEAKALPPAWVDNVQPAAAGPAGAPATRSVALLQLAGGVFDAPGSPVAGWRGTVGQAELRGNAANAAPWARTRDVAAEVQWAGGPLRVVVQPGRLELLGAALRWSRAEWQDGGGANATPRLDLQAELEPLMVAPLLARLQPDFGWGGDLRMGGHLKLRNAASFSADVVLERSAGDLTVTDETTSQALELSDLRLALKASDGTWNFTQGLAGKTLGQAAGAVVLRTSPQAAWPPADTPIDGVLELEVANLGTWGTWVPAGWRLGGALRTNAAIGGRFGAPEYTGMLRGNGLSVRNFLQGVNVADGEVAIALQGSTARIEKFTARAGAGTVTLEGNASLGAAPKADLKLVADKFQLLGRVDRRIVASGTAQLQLDRSNVVLDGQFGIDEGLIDFTRSDAPGLSDDVQVVRAKAVDAPASAPRAAAAGSSRKVALNLKVNLGDKLRLRGRGIDTGLRGELRVAAPGGKLGLIGTVSAVDGTYAAYGQKLQIDRGVIAFSGAADNPRLDIEATRPNTDVRVGVLITGTSQIPRIRLFSEPELSDIDKLSWLVLGRASDGLGRADTALLQRAAVALLSGEGEGITDQFTKAIGLDEVSLRQSEGDVRETVISLGKQLSRRWYVGYERSLNATTGTWQLIYRVAQRFTLRAQSGLDNSLDAIWTWRWQ
jgi:translocation and assembly module TamB